jgi:hypothetical protein
MYSLLFTHASRSSNLENLISISSNVSYLAHVMPLPLQTPIVVGAYILLIGYAFVAYSDVILQLLLTHMLSIITMGIVLAMGVMLVQNIHKRQLLDRLFVRKLFHFLCVILFAFPTLF